MIALRLAITELRRLSAGTLPKLAIIAMIVIPSLYAGLYVYANQDPSGSLHRVPAALVVQDRGATVTNAITGRTRNVNYGDRVAQRLIDGDGGFGWVETTPAQAQDGVRSGRYDAALFIGPEFSEDLTSTTRFQPRQANLELLTNDATNYLATTLARTAADDVRDAIAREVSTAAARLVIQGLRVSHTDLTRGVAGAQVLVDGSSRLSRETAVLVAGSAQVADGAEETASGASRLAAGADRLAGSGDRLEGGAAGLAGGLQDLSRNTAALPAETNELARGADRVAQGNAQAAALGQDAVTTSRTVSTRLTAARGELDTALRALVQQGRLSEAEASQLTGLVAEDRVPAQQSAAGVERSAARLDDLSRASAEVAAGNRRLAAAAPSLAGDVARAASVGSEVSTGSQVLVGGTRTLAADAATLSSATAQVAQGADRVAEASTSLRDGGTRLASGTTRLRDGLQDGLDKVPDLDPRTGRQTARTIGDPVGVTDDTLARAGSYGAGLAPFFMSLAAWIGAYLLFLIVRPLSSRALAAEGPAGRTALGGLVPAALVGLVQVGVMYAVVRFALDITPIRELGTALVLAVAAAAFAAILQALNTWLGAVGEFLGLALMLVQLVTAGGAFPWETMPEPLRALHWCLPMTYAVDGLRQTLYGGDGSILVRDLVVLGGVGLVALLITALAARRRRVWTPKRLRPELVV